MKNYPLHFRSSAEREIATVAQWYESQSNGRGSQFLDEVDRKLEKISQNPFGYQAISKRVRRAPMNRFPYLIFYRVLEEEVLIVGCRYAGQNPARWLNF